MQIHQEIEAALSTKQAARYLGVSPGTLAVWRARRAGPPCMYSGSKPVYYLSTLIGCGASVGRAKASSKKRTVVLILWLRRKTRGMQLLVSGKSTLHGTQDLQRVFRCAPQNCEPHKRPLEISPLQPRLLAEISGMEAAPRGGRSD
jgi:hypothetical protein